MSGYIISILIRIKPECVELVMEKTAVGDWFLLYLLGQNIDHIVFKVTRMVLAVVTKAREFGLKLIICNC